MSGKTQIKCVMCGVEKMAHNSSVGLYCSNKCQQNFAFKDRYEKWIGGVEEKSTKWLRRALAERDGNNCSVCKISSWMNKPIVFELDHIDGNFENNKNHNLRIICPNCHSQTDTYKNKNRGKGRQFRRKAEVCM